MTAPMTPEQMQAAIAQGIRDGVAAAGRTPGNNTNNRNARDFGPSQFGGRGRESIRGSLDPAGAAASQFGSVVDKAGGNVTQLGTNLAKATPILSAFSGKFGDILGYLEDTQATFKALSKVGAGLEGRLGELRIAAADTGLPLRDFANLIGRNSEQLAGFAGGVTGGIKVFRDLSKTMREDGTLEGFMNLGYTLEEANEFVLKNLEVQRRDARYRNADGSPNTKLMV
jgi:hypothetical protein